MNHGGAEWSSTGPRRKTSVGRGVGDLEYPGYPAGRAGARRCQDHGSGAANRLSSRCSTIRTEERDPPLRARRAGNTARADSVPGFPKRSSAARIEVTDALVDRVCRPFSRAPPRSSLRGQPREVPGESMVSCWRKNNARSLAGWRRPGMSCSGRAWCSIPSPTPRWDSVRGSPHLHLQGARKSTSQAIGIRTRLVHGDADRLGQSRHRGIRRGAGHLRALRHHRSDRRVQSLYGPLSTIEVRPVRR